MNESPLASSSLLLAKFQDISYISIFAGNTLSPTLRKLHRKPQSACPDPYSPSDTISSDPPTQLLSLHTNHATVQHMPMGITHTLSELTTGVTCHADLNPAETVQSVLHEAGLKTLIGHDFRNSKTQALPCPLKWALQHRTSFPKSLRELLRVALGRG